MLERHLPKSVFSLALKVFQRGKSTNQGTVKTACTQRDSIADLENLGATREGKVMLAMKPDPIAKQIGAILDRLLHSLGKGGFCLSTTARTAKGVGLMLNDFDLGQRYFKNLPLGGGSHTCSLQAGLAMGTGIWLIMMCLIWICALFQGGGFVVRGGFLSPSVEGGLEELLLLMLVNWSRTATTASSPFL